MQENKQGFELINGMVWKVLIKFAFPIFLSTIFQALYTMTDAIIIGQFAGTDMLAAIDSVYNVIKFPLNFFTGLSSGATIIVSQFVCAILIFFILLKTTLPCKIRITKIHFQGKYIKEIFKLGMPIGMQFVLFPISNMVVQSSINSFGVDSIAAWAVCGKLDFLIWSVLEALSVAVSVFIAQNYGAGKYKRVKQGVNFGILTGVVIIGSISFILYFHSMFLASLLIKKQSAILIVGSIMNFIAPFYVMAVFFEILSSAIRGMGESVRPMIITLITTCFFRIFWIMFIVPLKSSLFLTLSCYPLSWFIASISFIVCYLLILRKDRILHLSI